MIGDTASGTASASLPCGQLVYPSSRFSNILKGQLGPVRVLLTLLSEKSYYRARGVSTADVRRGAWRKSSFSNMNGSCVEISRLLSNRIGVRDTKDNGIGPVLIFTTAEWNAFIAGAKEGQFDNPS
jgi:hypothetical protein